MRKNHSKYSNIIPKNQFFRVLFGIKNQTIVFQESPFFKGGVFLRQRSIAFYLFCCQYIDLKAISWYFFIALKTYGLTI